jgi:hypothetical protein
LPGPTTTFEEITVKKKLVLALVLALVGAGMVYAQNWEFWGTLGTGLRVSTFGGGEDWDGPVYKAKWTPKDPYTYEKGFYTWSKTAEQAPYAPAISLYNADDGTYLDVKGMYTGKNFGVYAGVRLQLFSEEPFQIHGLYGWMNFFNNALTVKLGRIQDHLNLARGRGYIESLYPLWAAPGAKDCEYSYAEGDGLRIEYTGIKGLNVGVCFYVPSFAEDIYMEKDPYIFTGKPRNFYKQSMNPVGWMDYAKNATLEDFFMNTAFGMEYKSKGFDIAAGLKLDSKADGLTDSTWGDTYFGPGLWALFDGPDGPLKNNELLLLGDLDRDDIIYYLDKGMKAYAGFDFKMLKPWSIKAGGQIYNMGAFDEYGWIHLNQSIAYNLKWKFGAIKLSALQTIFNLPEDRKDGFCRAYEDEYHTPSKAIQSKVVYTFVPEFSFFGSGHTLFSIDAPVTIWPNIVNYDISVRPRLIYFTGRFLEKGLSAELQYNFNIIQFSKYSNGFEEGRVAGRTIYRDSDPLIQNTVQLQLRVSF